MLLEYLEDESLEHPVLRMYGDDIADAAATLRDALEPLASGAADAPVRIDELPGFHGVGGCLLLAELVDTPLGLQAQPDAPNSFRCLLDLEAWQYAVDLLEPFTIPDTGAGDGFQFLIEHGPIEWIISRDGGW